MSLEQAIQENTAAVKALTEMLAVLRAPAAKCDGACKSETAVTVTYPVAGETLTAPEAPKAEKKAAPAPKAEKPAAPAPEPAPQTAAAPKISLADLQAEGKKLLDAGKQADLKGVLAKVGGTKLSTLPEEKYAEVLPMLKALTANL